MDIEDSVEEQGLQANIFNKISLPPIQAIISPTLFRVEQPKLPAPKQTIKLTANEQPEQIVAEHTASDQPEQPTTEQTTNSTAIESLKSSSAEQIVLNEDLPAIEDLPSIPSPASQDEGYGHGVSIDFMIITPRVPILGEQLPNVGTNTDTEPPEIPQSSNALYLLRHAMMNIEKNFEDQALEHASLSTLAVDKQHRITMLESLLEHKNAINSEL